MAFTEDFGPNFTRSLLSALGSLGETFEKRKMSQQKSQLLQQLLGGGQPQGPMMPGGQGGQSAPRMGSAQILQAGLAGGIPQGELLPILRQVQGEEKIASQQQLSQQKEASKEKLARDRMEQQQRQFEETQAVGQSKDYLKSLRTRVEPAQDLYNTIKETKDLLRDPNLQIGPIKSLVPSRLQNEATQELVAKLNEIVTKKAQLGRGVPSKQRLLLEQLSKPQVWQKPETIRKLIGDLEGQLSTTLLEENIKDQLIKEQGKIPANLETLVKNQLKLTKNLPDPSEYSEDAIIEFGGRQFERVGDTWKPIGR